jgi:outer membrane protein OmpA-like peptidoglycan-associated protein
MTYVLAHFWPWFLGAFAVGLATALFARQAEDEGKVARWLLWAGLAFAAGVAVAALNVLIGRNAIWLETALATFAIFLAGAWLGALVRGGGLREHKGWALGLVPAALLWIGANAFSAQDLETALKQKAGAVIAAAGGDPLNVDVSGRDVLLPNDVLPNDAADRAALVGKLANVEGVRLVSGVEKLTGEAAELREKAMAAAVGAAVGSKAVEDAAASGAAAGDKSAAGLDMKPRAAKPTAKADAAKKAAKKPGVDPLLATADKAKAVLAALPASGNLDAASCQSALSATVALEKIQFRTASATIRLASAYVLDKLAGVMKRCPDVKVEVGGHTDNVGDDEVNDALSQRRADAVVKYLTGEGVAHGRLTGVGHGSKQPIASNEDDDGRAENRRIEFLVK